MKNEDVKCDICGYLRFSHMGTDLRCPPRRFVKYVAGQRFSAKGKQQIMSDMSMINFVPDDGAPPPDEGEVGFVIQVGPRIYSSDAGLFDTDDEAHAAAVRKGFVEFNIKPVLPL